MNPIYRTAAESTELGWLMGLTTLFFLASFLGWIWYAYRPANRARMDAYGHLPLDDDSLPGGEA